MVLFKEEFDIVEEKAEDPVGHEECYVQSEVLLYRN